ncbi:hypothetical protein [Nocardia sp. NPDC047648]|uniref:hypothetical protein n=1 Tax=Nocardia sp. NPDC047648 TaxID=3155625 RepID=UPI0033F40BC8
MEEVDQTVEAEHRMSDELDSVMNPDLHWQIICIHFGSAEIGQFVPAVTMPGS